MDSDNNHPTDQAPQEPWTGREQVDIHRTNGMVDSYILDGSMGDSPPAVQAGVVLVRRANEGSYTYPLTSVDKIVTKPADGK